MWARMASRRLIRLHSGLQEASFHMLWISSALKWMRVCATGALVSHSDQGIGMPEGSIIFGSRIEGVSAAEVAYDGQPSAEVHQSNG